MRFRADSKEAKTSRQMHEEFDQQMSTFHLDLEAKENYPQIDSLLQVLPCKPLLLTRQVLYHLGHVPSLFI
jgi:hypothetical protein